ncbi:MAG: hypothetical protein K6G88_01210 [Lachnospiraceae bacterium]|nr:hypothetical protein [Lachnospiraceae bacterium]
MDFEITNETCLEGLSSKARQGISDEKVMPGIPCEEKSKRDVRNIRQKSYARHPM